jgi:hypothetical protein
MAKARNEDVTLADVSKYLRYEPGTGKFFWLRNTRSKRRAGDVAGWLHAATGYICLGLFKRKYRGNRLAWLFITGEWPPAGFEVEHKNRIRSDNRKCNLRLATRSQNLANIPTSKRNTSGHRGVSWSKKENRWVAQIVVKGKRTFLGQYIDKDDAIEAYRTKYEEEFGEFATSLS